MQHVHRTAPPCAPPPLAVKPENILIVPKTAGAASQRLPEGAHEQYRALQAELRETAGQLSVAPDAASQRLHDYMAKLCDFGSAFVASVESRDRKVPLKDLPGRTPRGSSKYACPMVCWMHLARVEEATVAGIWEAGVPVPPLFKDGYNPFAADVWSYGVTVFVLASGRHPFRMAHVKDKGFRAFVRSTQPHSMQDQAVLAPGAAIWEDSPNLAWMWPPGVSQGLAHLLLKCLTVDLDQRWTMAQVQQHPWFGDPHWLPPEGVPAYPHTGPVTPFGSFGPGTNGGETSTAPPSTHEGSLATLSTARPMKGYDEASTGARSYLPGYAGSLPSLAGGATPFEDRTPQSQWEEGEDQLRSDTPPDHGDEVDLPPLTMRDSVTAAAGAGGGAGVLRPMQRAVRSRSSPAKARSPLAEGAKGASGNRSPLARGGEAGLGGKYRVSVQRGNKDTTHVGPEALARLVRSQGKGGMEQPGIVHSAPQSANA